MNMAVLTSKVQIKDKASTANRAEMQALIDELQTHMEKSRFQGKEKHISRARATRSSQDL